MKFLQGIEGSQNQRGQKFENILPEDYDDPNKKKTSSLASVSTIQDGKVSGYKYSEDSVPNIIAFCFGGEKNQEKLKEIYDKAEQEQDPKKKKQYIEDSVRGHAKSFDEGIANGMMSCFSNAQTQYQEAIKEGRVRQGEPLSIEKSGSNDKNAMFGIMSGLGLNVNSDNLSTTYSEGPGGNPKVFTMTFVNRPTEEMAYENSLQKKLARQYSDTLEGKEKQKFDADITQHQNNARNGEPKIPKEEFDKRAEKNHQESFNKAQVETQAKEVAKGLSKTAQPGSPSHGSSAQIGVGKGNGGLGR